MLTDKQARFVAAYLVDLNATQAAIAAGYSAKTATVQGSRLLTHVDVAAAVKDGQAKLLLEAQQQREADTGEAYVDALRVLLELGRLATVDTRSFFDETGNLKAIKDLTPAQGAAMASFEVIKKNAAAGDGIVDTIHKIKLWDKPRAIEMLAKHFGLLIERIEHSGGIELVWQETE